MKHARKRWLAMVAVCLGMAVPAQSELIVVPDGNPFDAESRYETYEFSDSAGSVRLGGNASGSVRQTQAEVPQPQSFEPVFDGPPPSDNSVGFATMQSPNQLYWRMGRVNIDQYGFNGGYTNFNVFVPLLGSPDDVLAWVNPRINVTDYGMAAANLGGGVRKYDEGRDRVYGASVWWDYDDGHARAFNQVGGSFESIGNYYSLRGNFAIPVGDETAAAGFSDGAVDFHGHNLSVIRTYFFDNALKSFDLELATPMPMLGRYGFEWGLGVYHLTSDSSLETTGVSARVQTQIADNFWMNGIYTHDDVFDSLFSLNFEVTLGKGMPRRFFRRPPVQSYMTQSVQRRYRVPVGKTSTTGSITAQDPNGVTVTIAYIDPTAAPGGDGTIENPFSSTTEYNDYVASNPDEFQIIFVYRNTDPNDSTNLDTGITLTNGPAGSYTGQRLIGDADLPSNQLPFIEGWFDGVAHNVNLPGRTGNLDGARPTLSNGGGNVVTIEGNSNEVFGFNIDGMNTGSGIVTAAATTTNGFYIHGNNFNNVVNGIDLASNTSTTPGLGFDGLGVIMNNTINGGTAGDRGININHTNGELALAVTNNTVNGFDTNPTSAGIFVLADGPNAEIIASGTGTTAAGTVYPVQNPPVQAEQPFTLGISDNTVDASSSGIGLIADNGASIAAVMDRNTVTNSTDAAGDGIAVQADNGSLIEIDSFNNNSATDGAGNGVVFQAENGSGVGILAAMLGNTFTGNDENGMFVEASGADSEVFIAGIGDGTVEGANLFNDNLLNGLEISAEAGGMVFVDDPIAGNQFNNNGDNGLLANSTGVDSHVDLLIGLPNEDMSVSNQFNDNGTDSGTGSGIRLNADSSGTMAAEIYNAEVLRNAGNGVYYTLNNTTQADSIVVGYSNVSNNGLGGVVLEATDMSGSVNEFIVGGSIVSGNLGGDGVRATLNDAGIDYMLVTESQVDNNAGHGVHVQLLDGSGIDFLEISDNNGTMFDDTGLGISNNLLSGIQISADDEAGFNDIYIGGNLINANRVHGTNIVLTNDSVIANAIVFEENTITGQVTGNGINLVNPDTDGADLTMALLNNTISGQVAGRGVNVELDGNAGLFETYASGNTISNNASFGYLLTATNTATYGLYMGSSTEDANVFNANVDAGIGILASGNTEGEIVIVNTSITNTTNGAHVDFAGEGFKAQLSGNADLTAYAGDASVANTTFSNNASDGFAALLLDNSDMTGGVVNTTLANNGRDGLRIDVRGNDLGTFGVLDGFVVANSTVTGNSANGLNFLRTSDGEIHDVEILGNTISDNSFNGISILAANANKLDDYTINQNTITNNRRDGVLFDIRADADIRADMDQNTITGNTQNGIHVTEQVNDPTDSRSITGNWTRNIVNQNGANGVFLDGAMNNLVVGHASDETLGNQIRSNAGSGVRVEGPGSVLIGSNDIRYNGTLSELGSANEDAGVYLAVRPYSNATVINNFISENNGDGIQYGIATGFQGFSSDITIVDNFISANAGRGIDLINRGRNTTNATISGNFVNSNLLEGVYIVNTASTTQNQWASSTAAMAADGSVVDSDPVLRLLFNDNEVRANGINSGLTTTGFILRVGTSDGSTSTSDEGGFASAGGFTTNPLGVASSRGGVIASVYDNGFGGNFGNDILFASFVSTATPATSAGTWSNTANPTVVTTYQTDPLARLDLYFHDNTFEAADVNNTYGVASADPSRVAFYNNAEGVFKSRLNTATPAGPFNSATRRRNAQRQAASSGGTSYLYPGLGDSTFRVNTDVGAIFQSAPGIIWPGAIAGETGYYWGNLP